MFDFSWEIITSTLRLNHWVHIVLLKRHSWPRAFDMWRDNLGNVSGTANMAEIRSEGREILPNITVLLNCFNKVRKTDRIKMFFFLVKRERPNLLSVKCETAILFPMNRDQYPHTPNPPPPPLSPSRQRGWDALPDLIFIPRLDTLHLKSRWPPARAGSFSQLNYLHTLLLGAVRI